MMSDLRTVAQTTALPSLDHNQLDTVFSMCTAADTDPVELYQVMTSWLEKVRDMISASQIGPETREFLNTSKQLSKKLRKYTRGQSALRYYYFGVFEEAVGSLEKQMEQETIQAELQSLLSRKHFLSIMTYLYRADHARLAQMALDLGIDRSNLYRELELYDKRRLVAARKVNDSKYYSLTAAGYRYYEKHLKKLAAAQSQKAKHLDDPEIIYYYQKERPFLLCGASDAADDAVIPVSINISKQSPVLQPCYNSYKRAPNFGCPTKYELLQNYGGVLK